MLDSLSDRLQGILGDLRKRGTLDEEAISRAMREIRLALLEADVNFNVVRQFVAQVRERAVGQDVLKSLTPGQQVVKIVNEELTALMGSGASELAFAPRAPSSRSSCARRRRRPSSSPATCSARPRSTSSSNSAPRSRFRSIPAATRAIPSRSRARESSSARAR